MSVPILYHYPMSPYSEKLRLTMGLLQLPWLSAQVAAYPPRAELAAVVGVAGQTGPRALAVRPNQSL